MSESNQEIAKRLRTPIAGSKHVMAGKKANRKGKSFEYKVRDLLGAWWGHGKFIRTPQSGANKELESFGIMGDVSTDATDWPFYIECKHHADLTILGALKSRKSKLWKIWEEVLLAYPQGRIPLLIFKDGGKAWLLRTHQLTNTVDISLAYLYYEGKYLCLDLLTAFLEQSNAEHWKNAHKQ